MPQSLLLAIVLVMPTGFAYLAIAVSSNTQVQTLAEDAMLGRVMAFYAMGALGKPAAGRTASRLDRGPDRRRRTRS